MAFSVTNMLNFIAVWPFGVESRFVQMLLRFFSTNLCGLTGKADPVLSIFFVYQGSCAAKVIGTCSANYRFDFMDPRGSGTRFDLACVISRLHLLSSSVGQAGIRASLLPRRTQTGR